MLDLQRVAYTHCELLDGLRSVRDCERGLLEGMLQGLVGAPLQVVRSSTLVQGPLEFLDAAIEFRVHVWFDLLRRHRAFPGADRGMAALVQAMDEDGLVGPVLGEVAWLAQPFDVHLMGGLTGWVADMVRAQGYIELLDATWSRRLRGWDVAQVMARMLVVHLEGMVPRRVEGQLYGCELEIRRDED